MNKDIAILKIKDSTFSGLDCGGDTFASLPVWSRGFPLENMEEENGSGITSGQVIHGTIEKERERFRWREEAVKGDKRWNKRPQIVLEVYPMTPTDEKKFILGFSGAPVIHEHDSMVVGMLVAKSTDRACIIPIREILDLVNEDQKSVSIPTLTINAGMIIDKGNEFYRNGNYESSIIEYDKILTDHNVVIAWNNKGLALDSLSKHDDDALKCFDKAIEINLNYVDAWRNKASLLKELGNIEDAEKCLKKSEKLQNKEIKQ